MIRSLITPRKWLLFLLGITLSGLLGPLLCDFHSNMTCYLSSSLFSMHFGHGTMSQIVCIQVGFFWAKFCNKKRALPQVHKLFCEKNWPSIATL